MTSPDRLLARLVRQGGGRLLNTAIDKVLPDTPSEEKVKRNIFAGIAGAVAMRVATRSVPGAIVVTSGLVAKKLYDRRKARKGKTKPAGQNTPPKA
ncbi:MAG: hypothetical protein EBR34_00895 [Sphingomonadaceae bacterium]|nr:hypothetical protein [Sphingomonadaceae bacterium]